MKKFLFTLVALLMAGTAVADEYMFINDFEVKQDQLGTTIANVEIYCHADYMFSAFTLDLGKYDDDGNFVENVLPGGLTVSGATVKMASNKVNYLMEDGEEETCSPSIGKAQNNTRFIGITDAMETEYDYVNDVLTACGAIKWKPGEFVMIKINLVVPADFEGGDLVLRNAPSAGNDPRYPDSTYPDKGQVYYKVCHITVEQTTPEPQDCEAPVINQTLGDNEVTVTITWNESDGNQVYTGQYTYTRPEYGQPDESYNVEAYTEASNTYNESPHATATINVPAKDPVWQDVAAPVITQEVGDDVVTVTIEWPNTTGTHVYTGEYTYTRPEAGQPDQSYDVVAYTEADYPYKESEHAEATINVPAKEPVVLPTLQGELVFSEVNQEDGTFTVTYNGNEEGVTVTITNYAVRAAADGQLPDYGTYDVTAVAKKDGYQDLEKTQALTWNAPQEKTQDPSIHVVSGDQQKIITFENNANDPDATIYYSLDGGETWNVYDGNPIVLGIGTYDIVYYAQAQGKAKSNEGELRVTVDENTQPDPTAVNELNGEKAVAGVRYFNMAGQEMQEANGVTIVVTTYTDGTTSAVKVIK